jgi:uncharacterized RmlC-like cupin family protein
VEEVRIKTSPGDYIFVPPFVPHRKENPGEDEEASRAARRRRSWSTCRGFTRSIRRRENRHGVTGQLQRQVWRRK